MKTETYETTQARMKKAFSFVENPHHWKAAIRTTVSAVKLESAGVSIAEVAEAVAFFTATTAMVRPRTLLGERVYEVEAPGYWAGPAN